MVQRRPLFTQPGGFPINRILQKKKRRKSESRKEHKKFLNISYEAENVALYHICSGVKIYDEV